MSNISDRKDEHIDACLAAAVESGHGSGFHAYRLAYRALPEIALDDVDLSTVIAGKTLRAPLIIGAMTGGTPRAASLNRVLAKAAQASGVGFALGSGRIALESTEAASSFQMRDVAPDALIFANLGAVQFNYGVTGAHAAHLVELLGADALSLHLNPLQEAVQEGGDTDFSGLLDRMAAALPEIPVPVFVKEVGAGIDAQSARMLASLPIAGLETAGVGGTSWARVEAFRAERRNARDAGFALGALGVPTVVSLKACREVMGDRAVIASGGLRTAEEMALALALGADAVACALPFLKAADQGFDAVMALLDSLVHSLRIAHFVCGARTPMALRGCLTREGDQ